MTVSSRTPRNSFAFDGSNLHATIFVPATITTANIGTDFQQIGTDSAFAPCRVMNNMVRQYREYRYRKVVCQWIPSVGPASIDAGSRVHIGWIDNPEQSSNYQLGVAPLNTAALRVPFVKGLRNVFTFNAWERITWNVPLTRRHPWFDVNTTDPASDINMFDRAVQGMVVQAYESVSAAVVLGTLKITFDVELRGLNPDVGAIV
jgi:hypothetical protein